MCDFTEETAFPKQAIPRAAELVRSILDPEAPPDKAYTLLFLGSGVGWAEVCLAKTLRDAGMVVERIVLIEKFPRSIPDFGVKRKELVDAVAAADPGGSKIISVESLAGYLNDLELSEKKRCILVCLNFAPSLLGTTKTTQEFVDMIADLTKGLEILRHSTEAEHFYYGGFIPSIAINFKQNTNSIVVQKELHRGGYFWKLRTCLDYISRELPRHPEYYTPNGVIAAFQRIVGEFLSYSVDDDIEQRVAYIEAWLMNHT